MLKTVKSYFYTGLIALLPIILTIYIFNWIVTIMMRLLNNSLVTILIKGVLSKFLSKGNTDYYFQILVYVVSLITMIGGTCLFGFILKNVFFARIMKDVRGLLVRIPLIKPVYSTLSQIIEITMSEKEKTFEKVVLLEYPRRDIYSLGFLTSENNYVVSKARGDEEKLYNVFIPTSPNPTSGMFVVVPQKDVKILDIKIDDAVKLIISGGVILPPQKEKVKLEENV